MKAEQLIRDGNLQEALRDLQDNVRKKPEDVKYRIFLFQLLSILGQWDRAINQLDVVGNLDKGTWPMVNTYKTAIACEKLRAEIFSGKSKPMIFGEPPRWIAWLLESLRLSGEGKIDEALSLHSQAFDQAAESSGMIDGKSFNWIADADSRLGPVLEIILNGQYYWAPFFQVKKIIITQANDLRDLVWAPAEFVWINGGQTVGLIPTRYAGSEMESDPALQLSRRTEWKETADGIHKGTGQRMLATDQEEYPLLDIRELVINP